MVKLSEAEIVERLKELKNWRKEGDYLIRSLQFNDFVSAVNFINKIVPIAEELEHHPDIELKDYNKLTIKLTTHDEGGITELDFILAKKIEDIVSSIK
ncbi:MAG: 4a-hydroxytetrahydrobiopterin dehydratase [Thermoproteota archaeon]|jgi:4a-hydroxytetrahydrobiopterin dehydratase|nr:4a-hydroxytetrahydrobiopterin dehydratase [Thermoproteota archaeon]